MEFPAERKRYRRSGPLQCEERYFQNLQKDTEMKKMSMPFVFVVLRVWILILLRNKKKIIHHFIPLKDHLTAVLSFNPDK